MLLTIADDEVYGRARDPLDGIEAKADTTLAIDGELIARLIDIRAEDSDAHRSALVHELDELGDIAEVTAQGSCHVLSRIVRLEVSRLVGDPAVAGSMALVEGIAGELRPVTPDLL